ncbi:outer membrane lipoprotein carrier protein LolA [Emcibacter sp.]|uniref:LolA family protein n=1 Tax=Emcibacter sp. TaxID=1979954 RepID=UPI002AA788AA|nr:outer membrane lipoprotein carrier protein LolA [Emcibacter sp.]
MNKLLLMTFLAISGFFLAAPAALAVERAAQAEVTTVEPAPSLVTGEDRTQVIARIEESLNTIKSLTAQFIQRAPDGAVSEGTVFLERPGKLRFDYEDDLPFLIVSDGTMLSFVDYEVDQVTRWPISKTPLGILVDETVSLSGKIEVPEIIRFAGLLKVPVVDKERDEQGYITLIFEESTMELRAWEVMDAQGYLTRVALVNPQYNVDIDKKRFTFKDPRPVSKRPFQGPRR